MCIVVCVRVSVCLGVDLMVTETGTAHGSCDFLTPHSGHIVVTNFPSCALTVSAGRVLSFVTAVAAWKDRR